MAAMDYFNHDTRNHPSYYLSNTTRKPIVHRSSRDNWFVGGEEQSSSRHRQEFCRCKTSMPSFLRRWS
jgi:hypothetical protein